MEGKGQQANIFARSYFRSFVVTFFFSTGLLLLCRSTRRPGAAQEENRPLGLPVRSSPNCRPGQPGCFESGALYFPTGTGGATDRFWLVLPLRLCPTQVCLVDPVRGGRYEDGGGKGADVRNWSPDGVEVSEARNREERGRGGGEDYGLAPE